MWGEHIILIEGVRLIWGTLNSGFTVLGQGNVYVRKNLPGNLESAVKIVANILGCFFFPLSSTTEPYIEFRDI